MSYTLTGPICNELWLRGQYGVRGSERFGSREALMGRVLCRCGLKMKKLPKRITEWSDDALVRIIDYLEIEGPIHFKGGLVVEDGDGEK